MADKDSKEMTAEKEIASNSDAARIARREAAIQEYRNRGYLSGQERRPVRSNKHAEFLTRAGLIALP